MLEQEAVHLIEARDPAIFTIESQTSTQDRISLLAAQGLARSSRGEYAYLEIGSFRGGTLVPYLLDPSCKHVVSIDKRPDGQPDERARYFSYQGVTTKGMVEQLRRFVPLTGLGKLATFDADASQISPAAIGVPIDVALIDGEHTNVATFSDFMSLFPALTPDAMVVFHDANLILDAIRNVECFLRYSGVSYRTFFLHHVVAMIALRGSQAAAAERLALLAHDPVAFARDSRRNLHESIAQAVAEGAHLAVS